MKDIFSKIDKNSLIQTFIRLVRIESPSYGEKRMIGHVIKALKKQKLKAGLQRNEGSGNIVACLKGQKKRPPLFFNAHLDTVEPCRNVKPVITDKLIRSDGSTILGADDKSALAIFLEGIRYIRKYKILCPDIYFILTYAEEQGLVGAKNLDFRSIRPKYGFSFDSGGSIGRVILAAPTHYQYKIMVRGKAAHAGIEPEKGISAIKIASELVREIRTGRIDGETTANIGRFNGGIATNIVPENVVMEGEVRSRDRQKTSRYIRDLRKLVSRISAKFKVRIHFQLTHAYDQYQFREDSFLVRKFSQSCVSIGLKPVFERSNGGSDANILNQNGFQCLNCSVGMSDVHSTGEYIRIKDLVLGLKLFLSLIINW
ncbi:MAG: M20/M25/M40 family metallo-hydrolase [bacterium]|nr:M20/M25/M40 family metallo-hydrolase [bacterium]